MRKKIDILILMIVLVCGVYAAFHAQAIGDWWHSTHYNPPEDVQLLAEDAGMSDKGEGLFYRFEPQIVSQEDLNNFCDTEKLGCTESRSIYLLAPTGEAEKARTVVTAAHEMLHVAYNRLNDSEKQTIENLLETELDKPGALSTLKELDGYPQEDYFNEAHSFIGSQLSDLGKELEEHYSRYFSDRKKTIDAFLASPER